MTSFNSMQAVKRQFFALRNGIIADTIRKTTGAYKIIFGLNLPQLSDIAAETGKNEPLADALWENKSTRESMMLAPMLVSAETFPIKKSRKWASEAPTQEVADILCHKLLRHTPYALELAESLAQSPVSMDRYVAIRLLFNLLPASAPVARKVCEHELTLHDSETMSITRRLLDELDFFQ